MLILADAWAVTSSIATVVATLVAAAYTVLTYQLWRETRETRRRSKAPLVNLHLSRPDLSPMVFDLLAVNHGDQSATDVRFLLDDESKRLLDALPKGRWSVEWLDKCASIRPNATMVVARFECAQPIPKELKVVVRCEHDSPEGVSSTTNWELSLDDRERLNRGLEYELALIAREVRGVSSNMRTLVANQRSMQTTLGQLSHSRR